MFEVPAANFSLGATLTSGQTFRWHPHDGWWYGFIGSSVVKVKQDDGRLLCETSDPSLTPERLSRYFALDVDLADVLRQIDVDIQIHQAIVRHRGLRILRQDSWEVLGSFICASFNNIKRIEGMIGGLCQAYGRPVALTPPPFAAAEGGSAQYAGPVGPAKGGGVNGFRDFSFPAAETIAGIPERRLRSLGLGYRAPYLKATARLVAEGVLAMEQLRRVDYEATKAALLHCEGVGDKVADCVALFGFEKYEAFPIDVWIERAMRYYFRHRKATRGRIHAYARSHFGPYAGYAQQYLYHYVRNLRS
jgi:N-glycosylase/DNA lyase